MGDDCYAIGAKNGLCGQPPSSVEAIGKSGGGGVFEFDLIWPSTTYYRRAAGGKDI